MDLGPVVLIVGLLAIVGGVFAGIAAFAWVFSHFGTRAVAEDFGEGGSRAAEHDYVELNR